MAQLRKIVMEDLAFEVIMFIIPFSLYLMFLWHLLVDINGRQERVLIDCLITVAFTVVLPLFILSLTREVYRLWG
jgi:hypothetical protein